MNRTVISALLGFAVAIALACAAPGSTPASDPANEHQHAERCYEDEVIVWVEDGHDACVALDDMWEDEGSIVWYRADERRLHSHDDQTGDQE